MRQAKIHQFVMEANQYLDRDVRGFFCSNFYPYSSDSSHEDPLDFLRTLKNDLHLKWGQKRWKLEEAVNVLGKVLQADFRKIFDDVKPDNNLTVCAVPRAKKDEVYRADQLLFKDTVAVVAKDRSMHEFQDGSDFIIRHTNTKTTHLKNPPEGFNNDGPKPYPGIACDTCHFAPQIEGRDILLVDDIYTRNVGIDEDMAQALFDKGARSVVFYAVGRTVGKY